MEFFWSVFLCICTEYGNVKIKPPYSLQIQKKLDQKKIHNWTLFVDNLATVQEFVVNLFSKEYQMNVMQMSFKIRFFVPFNSFRYFTFSRCHPRIIIPVNKRCGVFDTFSLSFVKAYPIASFTDCKFRKNVSKLLSTLVFHTNCLSMFDHFVGLALKGLSINTFSIFYRKQFVEHF